MNFSTSMYNPKQFYPYKHNKSTYLVYDNNCSINEECDFKVKIIAGMW